MKGLPSAIPAAKCVSLVCLLLFASVVANAQQPPSPVLNFDGIGAIAAGINVIPPSTNLAVGATQVVQVVNGAYAVYDKSGNSVAGPSPIHNLFASLPGGSSPCETTEGGSPIVLYDQIAGRWLISQIVFPTSTNGVTSNHVCIAVSKTNLATGGSNNFNAYDYDRGSNLPGNPKFGVWPDAYFFSADTYAGYNGSGAGTFIGAEACAFERTKMLAGQAASAVCFQGNTSLSGMLPSNLDGSALPPSGSPNFFLQLGANSLSLYKFQADFAKPQKSKFTGPTSIPVASFTKAPSQAAIPQPQSSQLLEGLGDSLMYRLSYRNFGAYQSLVVDHTVQVNGPGQTGIRWYEIRNPNSSNPNSPPTVTQQGTYSPDTSTYRWLGSVTQDKQGNMLLGYSASSSSLNPSIYYTGRLNTDPPNQMEGEGVIQVGGGSQTNTGGALRGRWGDYSSVAVDPVDNCTFWFATEYLPYTADTPPAFWNTRIATVKFPGCQ